MKKILLLVLIFVGVACSGEVSKESALESLQKESRYNCFHYAPIHIGRVVLTGESHENSQKYITSKYGQLIEKGLIDVQVTGKNAWRTTINVVVTETGEVLCDPRRSDKEHAFVAVCKLKPCTIDTIIVHKKDSVEYKYIVEQTEVTDFGTFLGYSNGKKYNVKEIK